MARLAVRSLTVTCFRSLQRVSVDARCESVILIGENGVGKTNVLEAVSLLTPGRGLRRSVSSEMIRVPGCSGWKIAADVDCPDHPCEIETSFGGSGSRVVRLDGKPVPQTALGRVMPVMWLVPVMDRLWLEGSDGRRRFLDRLALNFRPEHAGVSLAYDKALRQRNRMLKEGVRDSGWFDVVERQMAESGAAVEANRRVAVLRLDDAQAGNRSGFPVARLSLRGPEKPVSDVTADDLIDEFRTARPGDMRAGRTRNGPHRTDLLAVHEGKGIPARQCSTGEQKALLMSLVLSGARAIIAETGVPPVLLLDEVAAHLDEVRRSQLYGELAEIPVQTWMTGTDPRVFEPVERKVRRLVVTAAGGETSITECDRSGRAVN
ncbi:MAG: DNA replication/repair protein RecF [Rhodobacteraceae bacterium]|nr:DNA replication/repair protein RecF [Paracoccaceae bacterium]MCY4138681.1 DNA replication/repair protein RecF [Paracoccaceae bacterium]